MTSANTLPHGWRWAKVGDVLVETQYGLSLLSSPDGDTPIVGMKDLADGRVTQANLARVMISEPEIARYLLREGDILLNRTNSANLVGKIGYVDGSFGAVFASYLVRLKPDTSIIDPKFLVYWLTSSRGQQEIKPLITRGVSQANINPTAFCQRVAVPLPPLSEQRRIADILAMWDRVIEITNSLAIKKSKTLNVLSRELLFGARRCGKRHKTKRLRHRRFSIPSEWAVVQVENIARQVTETNSQSERIPVLSCTKYDGLVDSLEYFDRQVFGADVSGYKVVTRGQFAYATNHLEEGSIGYQHLYERGLVSPMYTVFETDGTAVCDGYLWKLFKTDVFLHVFRANTSASVDRRGGLRWDEFARIQVPLPQLAEQIEINGLLDIAQREIALIKNQRKALTRQRDALASELLTGRLRVRDAEQLGVVAAG